MKFGVAASPRLASHVPTSIAQLGLTQKLRLGHWHAIELTADKQSETPPADGMVAAVVRHMRDESGVLACAIGYALRDGAAADRGQDQLDRAVQTTARAVREVAEGRGLA